MLKPKVLCVCLTYGRPHLLNEAVESFHRQDYQGEKHMLIANDDPRCQYVYDNQDCTIINYPKRFDHLWHKFNHCVESWPGPYDYHLIWADDDIMLPWAISTAVDSCNGRAVWYPRGRYYWQGKIRGIKSTTTMAPLVSKAYWETSKGYRHDLRTGVDKDYLGRARAAYGEVADEFDPAKVYYVYRWGIPTYHISSRMGKPNAWESIEDYVNKKIQPGRYEIQPKWEQDYVRLVKAFREA